MNEDSYRELRTAISREFQTRAAWSEKLCFLQILGRFGELSGVFVARPKSSGGLIDLKQFGKIGSKRILKVPENKCGNFVVDTGSSKEPMKLLQKGKT